MKGGLFNSLSSIGFICLFKNFHSALLNDRDEFCSILKICYIYCSDFLRSGLLPIVLQIFSMEL